MEPELIGLAVFETCLGVTTGDVMIGAIGALNCGTSFGELFLTGGDVFWSWFFK